MPNHVKFDGGNPADSSTLKFKLDSRTFTARTQDGGALFASYMFAIYSRVEELGLTNVVGARIPVPQNLNLKA